MNSFAQEQGRARTRRQLLQLSLGIALLPAAHAQPAPAFPSRPLRIVVPFPAGGAVDAVARVLAQQLQTQGVSSIVENKPGGNGVIAADHVAKAQPDGHTLLLTTDSPIVGLPFLGEKLPYRPLDDLKPVAQIATLPLVLVVPGSLPVRNVQELVAMVREAPGKYNYASNGEAGGPHIAMEQFKTLAGLDITHVPYRGSAQASQDLAAARVTAMFSGISSVAPMIESGKLRAIGVSSRERSSLLPDVPSIADQGFPSFERKNWMGVFAPAGLTGPVAAELQRLLETASSAPGYPAQLIRTGNEVGYESSVAFSRRVQNDYQRVGDIMTRLKEGKR